MERTKSAESMAPLKAMLATGVMAVAGLVFAANPPTAKLATDAALRLDGDDARLQFALFDSLGGRYMETLNEHAERVSGDNSISFRLVRSSRSVMGAGRATLRAEKESVRFACDYTAHTELRCGASGFLLRLRAAPFAGAAWKADGQDGVFPAKPVHTQVAEGAAKSFAVGFPGGKRTWTLAFAKPVKFLVLDTRRQNRDEFEVRFACEEKIRLALGKGGNGNCLLSSSDGKIKSGVRDFHGVWANDRWVKLTEPMGIRQGSALDFSRGPTRRTPAGVDGAIFATTNGEFRFARRPTVAQRLFGCRVESGRLFAAKPKTAEFTKALTRFGYNSIRLKYAENRLLQKGPRGLVSDPELSPAFDQLVTSATRDGLYSFYDLLTPREWTWDDLGLQAPGGKNPEPELAAALTLLEPRSSEAWKASVAALYGRRNKVGRTNYPQDIAVPLVSVFSDCSAFSSWEDLRALPFLRSAYGNWLKQKRAKEPDFMQDAVCEEADFGVMPLHEKKAASIRRFLAEREAAGVGRMRDYLETLKCKALVGAALTTWHYRELIDPRLAASDFTGESFSIDPPRHLGEKWTAPYRIDNVNPLDGQPIPGTFAGHENRGRPFCLFSWNAPGPSAWRVSSGLLIGAWAGKHGWAGVWREGDPFADPFTAASERAVYALFARGDMTSDAPADALVIKDGALTVKTPRTAGGFSPAADGSIVAEPFKAKLKGARAAIWVSSLTDAPIATSKRLLLTHLTELQKEGTLFADSRCDLMMRRGTGSSLLRDGSAAIELAVEKPSAFRIYALAPDGLRQTKIVSDVRDGLLTFTAEVRGAKGAQYLYELTRE